MTATHPIPHEVIAYYRHRNRARVYAAVMKTFADCAASKHTTKADLARSLERDAAQISRWLSGPANWTLDTISDLLLACNSEMDYSSINLDDHKKSNFEHELAAAIEHELFQKTFLIKPTKQMDGTGNTASKHVKTDIKELVHHG